MEVGGSLKELLRVLLDVRLEQDDVAVLEQAGEVVVHVREDHESFAELELLPVACVVERQWVAP